MITAERITFYLQQLWYVRCDNLHYTWRNNGPAQCGATARNGFSQIVKEGTPIIAGCLPAGFDTKSMMSVYTPHTMPLNLRCAEMIGHYGIPHSGTSGSGPGWGPDLQAGGSFWMNHLTSLIPKVGLAPFVGGNFDSLAFRPATVVYANEVICLSRIFSQGFSIDAEHIDVGEIGTIGSAGNYMSAMSTGKRSFSLFKGTLNN